VPGVSASLAFIRANTALAPVPGVPEVSLHLADDVFGLWERTERELGATNQPPPFWAFAWPGGQALARYLLDHADLVRDRSVLDLGSGSGLTAIAAAKAGARVVTASELDQFALAAIALNASANAAPVTAVGDVLDGDGAGAEVVLAADIWYERQLAERALGLLRRARARGATVLAGDVGRAFLPRELMRELASYQVRALADLEGAAVRQALILTLR
jgi:predicted nicotinamide N-methyase